MYIFGQLNNIWCQIPDTAYHWISLRGEGAGRGVPLLAEAFWDGLRNKSANSTSLNCFASETRDNIFADKLRASSLSH